MAFLTRKLLALTVVLGVVQLVVGYSYRNCIEDQWSQRKSFHCTRRYFGNMSYMTQDLPVTAVNLTISHCNVSRIDDSLSHLSNLQHLSISPCNLRIIDMKAFQKLSKLKTLDLSFNELSELKPLLFEDLHNLHSLLLAHNKLRALPEEVFLNTLGLETLNMGTNLLTNFFNVAKSVSHLMNLTVLDLSFNHFTSLTYSNVSLPRSLTKLSLSGNNLLTLGCQATLFNYVKLLDLSNNTKLTATAFQGVDLSHLNSLRLQLTNVDILKFLIISNVSGVHVDFSGTGLKNKTQIEKLCELLKKKHSIIKKLRLDYNGIRSTSFALHYCPTITKALDLSHNNLKTIKCLGFLDGQEKITELYAEHNHLTSLLPCKNKSKPALNKLEKLSYRYNRILSVSANAFHLTPNIKTLQLNINSIAFFDHHALKGLKKLHELRLDNNLLTDLFNDTFANTYNLKILNLRNNRISVIFNGTFHYLKKLTILDLGGNKITQFQAGGFDGLTNLSKLYLDGNNLKQIDTSFYYAFQDTLQVLDLNSNKIRFLRDDKSSPFMNFSKLTDLKLGSQRPHGLTILPRTLFRGLHSLKSLYLTNNKISHIPHDAFDDLTGLHFLTLDNCCVGRVNLQPGVFKNLRNLTKLVIENMGLQSFTREVFGNLTQLRILQANHNAMQSIPVDVLESLTKLQYLDIRNVSLSCTCENILLQNYTLHNPDLQVIYLYNLQCPEDKRRTFFNFNTEVCFIDLEKYLFFCTAVVIFLFTVTPLLHIKLYWKVKYGYYVFRAWFSDHWSRIRDKEENCQYDAFISYNSSDEEWVMDYLVPNLEGNKSPFKLCLHHRDFELGRDIVDNIVNAVYSSRKTVCVVSRSFLCSEWCSLEIQLASYRLFDEHRDVLLLVFLEPISERQLSSYHRMRKVMLKKTYLQWPGPDTTNLLQAQELFWSQLRRAIRAGNRLETEDGIQESYAAKDDPTENPCEDQTPDENCPLLV
ncbi:Toll-like receptor 13 [Oryzias melastigma]|uniref:Toll-like receptor 13 n=1 Tax=Oryzias melastigma TaxID=30732 RepID=A0A834BXS8_ORYME|nr:Toll-like receptor 13 [Oryzias melastigma]